MGRHCRPTPIQGVQSIALSFDRTTFDRTIQKSRALWHNHQDSGPPEGAEAKTRTARAVPPSGSRFVHPSVEPPLLNRVTNGVRRFGLERKQEKYERRKEEGGLRSIRWYLASRFCVHSISLWCPLDFFLTSLRFLPIPMQIECLAGSVLLLHMHSPMIDRSLALYLSLYTHLHALALYSQFTALAQAWPWP